MQMMLCRFYAKTEHLSKRFQKNVSFYAEITVCHIRETVLDKKLQQKTKNVCAFWSQSLRISHFHFLKHQQPCWSTVDHDSWEFWYLVSQLHSASSGSWGDTADKLFTEWQKTKLPASKSHEASELRFAAHKNIRPENQFYSSLSLSMYSHSELPLFSSEVNTMEGKQHPLKR